MTTTTTVFLDPDTHPTVERLTMTDGRTFVVLRLESVTIHFDGWGDGNLVQARAFATEIQNSLDRLEQTALAEAPVEGPPQ